MKKLMLLAGAVALIFASCCNKPAEPATDAQADEQGCCNKEQKCEMTEEQKQACADWENWANLEDARKAELLDQRKACFDKHQAECAEKEAECAEKRAEFDAKMANWDNMTIDEKKALFDEMDQCCPHKKGCCKEGEGCKKEGEGCKKEGEGCKKECNHECKK